MRTSGLYLASEVLGAKGATLAGMLPAELQNYVVYAIAVPAHNTSPDPALAFVKFVSDVCEPRGLEGHGIRVDGGHQVGSRILHGVPACGLAPPRGRAASEPFNWRY